MERTQLIKDSNPASSNRGAARQKKTLLLGLLALSLGLGGCADPGTSVFYGDWDWIDLGDFSLDLCPTDATLTESVGDEVTPASATFVYHWFDEDTRLSTVGLQTEREHLTMLLRWDGRLPPTGTQAGPLLTFNEDTECPPESVCVGPYVGPHEDDGALDAFTPVAYAISNGAASGERVITLDFAQGPETVSFSWTFQGDSVDACVDERPAS
jgi:hypothetical protein